MIEKEAVEKSATAFGEVLFTFPVYYHMWEVDGYGCVVKNKDGNNVLVLTTHSRAYVADKKELEEKLEEYKNLISETEKALSLLRNHDERFNKK